MVTKVCLCWHAAFTAEAMAAGSAIPASAAPIGGKTAGQLNLDKSETYKGNAREFQNWLFSLVQYCTVYGVTNDREQVKVAVIFLAG